MSSDQMTSSALKKRRLHETTISENRSPDSDGDSDSDSGAGGGGVSGGKASLLPTTPSAVNTTNGDISQGDISFDSTGIPKKPIRPREKRSEVWNYFEVQEINSNGQIIKVGKCKNCPFYGKYSSSTSFMKEHLRKCKGLHGLNPTLTTPGGTLVSVLLDPAAIATAATTTTTTTTTATTAPEPMVTVVEEGHPNPVDAIEGKLITPNKPKRNVRAKIARKSGANENENDLAALTAAASAATPATSSSSAAGAGSASRKEKFNASDKNFDWGSVWEALTDVRRAQYPKAMSALLEELGVFEVNDLKSLDYDQIELLSSLLKSAPKKAFFELLKL